MMTETMRVMYGTLKYDLRIRATKRVPGFFNVEVLPHADDFDSVNRAIEFDMHYGLAPGAGLGSGNGPRSLYLGSENLKKYHNQEYLEFAI